MFQWKRNVSIARESKDREIQKILLTDLKVDRLHQLQHKHHSSLPLDLHTDSEF